METTYTSPLRTSDPNGHPDVEIDGREAVKTFILRMHEISDKITILLDMIIMSIIMMLILLMVLFCFCAVFIFLMDDPRTQDRRASRIAWIVGFGIIFSLVTSIILRTVNWHQYQIFLEILFTLSSITFASYATLRYRKQLKPLKTFTCFPGLPPNCVLRYRRSPVQLNNH